LSPPSKRPRTFTISPAEPLCLGCSTTPYATNRKRSMKSPVPVVSLRKRRTGTHAGATRGEADDTGFPAPSKPENDINIA
jgi:hypothetical protein